MDWWTGDCSVGDLMKFICCNVDFRDKEGPIAVAMLATLAQSQRPHLKWISSSQVAPARVI